MIPVSMPHPNRLPNRIRRHLSHHNNHSHNPTNDNQHPTNGNQHHINRLANTNNITPTERLPTDGIQHSTNDSQWLSQHYAYNKQKLHTSDIQHHKQAHAKNIPQLSSLRKNSDAEYTAQSPLAYNGRSNIQLPPCSDDTSTSFFSHSSTAGTNC